MEWKKGLSKYRERQALGKFQGPRSKQVAHGASLEGLLEMGLCCNNPQPLHLSVQTSTFLGSLGTNKDQKGGEAGSCDENTAAGKWLSCIRGNYQRKREGMRWSVFLEVVYCIATISELITMPLVFTLHQSPSGRVIFQNTSPREKRGSGESRGMKSAFGSC